MDYEPIAVALKFGFLAVLYLFLLWVARSALRDLRRTSVPAPEATGFHPQPAMAGDGARSEDAWLVAERGGGLEAGERFDLFGGLSIGRSADADVPNEDAYFARAPMFAVADGMGGAQAGEVASRIATDAFDSELGSGPAEAELRSLVESANREIHELAKRDA